MLDFGLAKSVENADSGLSAAATISAAGTTREGTVLGTPAYMSPEQARGRPVDRKTDVWSFGCVLYEMLAGRRAFSADTASDTLVAVLSREPDSVVPAARGAGIREAASPPVPGEGQRAPPPRRRRHPSPDRGGARRASTRRPGGGRRAERFRGSSGRSRRSSRGAGARPRRRPRHRRRAPLLLPRSSRRRRSPSMSRTSRRSRRKGGGSRSPASRARCGRSSSRISTPARRRRSRTANGTTSNPTGLPTGSGCSSCARRSRAGRLQPADIFGQYPGADVWALEIETGRETLLVENAANPVLLARRKPHRLRRGLGRPPAHLGRGRARPQRRAGELRHVGGGRPSAAALVAGRRADLVFQNVERTKFDVRVLDLASKRLTWVTNDQVQDICPVWSPSGGRIYFSSYRSGGLNIWAVPVDAQGSPSGPLQQLTTRRRAGRLRRRFARRKASRLFDPAAERRPLEAAGVAGDGPADRRAREGRRDDPRGQPRRRGRPTGRPIALQLGSRSGT